MRLPEAAFRRFGGQPISNVPDVWNRMWRISGRDGRGVLKFLEKYGAVARDRTVDLVINSHTLYRLSYNGLSPAIERIYKKVS